MCAIDDTLQLPTSLELDSSQKEEQNPRSPHQKESTLDQRGDASAPGNNNIQHVNADTTNLTPEVLCSKAIQNLKIETTTNAYQ